MKVSITIHPDEDGAFIAECPSIFDFRQLSVVNTMQVHAHLD